jgi:hypothetical protein
VLGPVEAKEKSRSRFLEISVVSLQGLQETKIFVRTGSPKPEIQMNSKLGGNIAKHHLEANFWKSTA